jgi:hypothetical protein
MLHVSHNSCLFFSAVVFAVSQTSKQILEDLVKTCELFDVHNVFAVVTDGGANVVLAIATAVADRKRRDAGVSSGSTATSATTTTTTSAATPALRPLTVLLHHVCIAHTLQLPVSALFRNKSVGLGKAFVRLRKLVAFAKASPLRRAELRALAMRYVGKAIDIPNDNATRWISKVKMLVAADIMRLALNEFATIHASSNATAAAATPTSHAAPNAFSSSTSSTSSAFSDATTADAPESEEAIVARFDTEDAAAQAQPIDDDAEEERQNARNDELRNLPIPFPSPADWNLLMDAKEVCCCACCREEFGDCPLICCVVGLCWSPLSSVAAIFQRHHIQYPRRFLRRAQ